MKEFRKVLIGAAFILCLTSLGFAATLTVSNTTDVTDGICDADCSLRDAIAVANSTVDDDEIVFDSAVFSSPQIITLSGTELTLSNNGSITISGPGAELLTISGNNASRVLTVTDSTVANISGITVTEGNGVSPINTGRAGGIYNSGGTLILNRVIITGNNAANGGGLNNSTGTASTPGNLTIRNCIVSNNTATGTGGGLQNFSTSTILIENSTFSGNVSNGTSGGGGMGVNGFVTVSNSTFVGNSAPNGRGGGMQSNGSLFILTNVTITGNTAATIGGGYYRSSTNTNNFIRNTIIAGNSAPEAPDATQANGGTIMSQGNNIIGVVGTSIGWVASDILDVDAKLSPVGNYGGFGMTVAPMNDSPAIDAGQNCVRDLSCSANNPVNAVSSDQRLANRDDATVDIGAYETNSAYVAELPNGELAEAYNFVITPNAGTFTYGITSGTLPPGLNFVTSLFRLAKSGVPAGVVSLSGTPTSAGTFPFSLTINGAGNSAVVNYSLTINGTSANVSVGGKVINSFGAGISGAIVTISDGGSFIQSRRANTFGYFNFDGIPSGQNYSITVQRKGYTFDPFPITPTGNVNDVVITSTSSD